MMAAQSDTAVAPPALLGPLCTMARAMPVFTYDLAPGETAQPPKPRGYAGPVGIVLGEQGGLAGPLADGAITLNLPMPGENERRDSWAQQLNSHASDVDALAERFILPCGHIKQAARMAIAQAALDNRMAVTVPDVQAACRLLNRQLLDSHAARLDTAGGWSDLVVNEATHVKLRDLALRCRHRERLLAHLGQGFTGANRGVRALFSGASGTGKTLAAKALAAELGMDIYRVDLGAVVNKYIGETEKNLHQVLSRAEALDVILLLDEGDALLGSRTDVKSANDRYANLETDYLLQRLETFQGVVVVTTNAAQNIDRAFQRRMDVVVPFIHPQADERRAIWHLHLQAAHAIPGSYLEEVVQRCAFTGGQIRNAALHATLLALEDRGTAVRQLHLETAVRSEYRKAGATCPLDGEPAALRRYGMTAFLEVMRT
jgi:gluconate kinase